MIIQVYITHSIPYHSLYQATYYGVGVKVDDEMSLDCHPDHNLPGWLFIISKEVVLWRYLNWV